ncbi:MAG: VOC family protein [Acidimicrobiales bacterium]|jgi:catechol 2,3-dioxygenase-like lactoylglutathione lyase family enzyme
MEHTGERVSFEGGKPSGPLPITQIAFVVRDIDKALENFHRTLGWGPWNIYEHKPPALHDTYLYGEPTPYTMIGAEAHVGPIDVELIQPVDGPSIYKEWLDEHGEGVHHIAVMRATMEDAKETEDYLAELGAPVIMEGRIGDSIRFFYVDAQPTLKVILESGSGHAVDMTPVRVYPPES